MSIGWAQKRFGYMTNSPAARLTLTVEQAIASVFTPLLGLGFRVEGQLGCSIRELLCRQFGLAEDYVDHRIQTVFLNGKAVDDLDTAIVTPGCTLALSAALPGLVGATFRRSGHYSSMRSNLSHKDNPVSPDCVTGDITLKLFNLTAAEIGPLFLRRGIRISLTALKEVVFLWPEAFSRYEAIDADGQRISLNDLLSWDPDDVEMMLSVRILSPKTAGKTE
ncbi:MAG: hypothetical protein PHV74_05345 [Dehalococcoidia bacterium]|nr:hypothetical protein [Dehalococcoidia bacterium]